MEFLKILEEIRSADVIDMILMTVLIYAVLVWFKKSKAVFILIGLFMVGIVYLLARQFGLNLTTTILQGFFAVILLALIVIFQEEIRHFFERVAVSSFNRRFHKKKLKLFSHQEVETIVRTVTDLGRDRIGAIMVLKGKDPIARHLQGGMDLNGELSEALLKSLFDPHSDGHDGALIIDGNSVLQFSCHLPLSKDVKKVQRSGTRHAAALGLAELTDAMVLVVSEEQGTVSVAYQGDIETVSDPDRLKQRLTQFYQANFPAAASRWHEWLTQNFREKIMAVVLTIIMWIVLVYENKLSFVTFTVPVEHTNLASNLKVADITPPAVQVTLSGRRSNFYLINEKDVRIVLNMFNEEPGMVMKEIHRPNVFYPDTVTLENISPGRARLLIESEREADPAPKPAASKKPRT